MKNQASNYLKQKNEIGTYVASADLNEIHGDILMYLGSNGVVSEEKGATVGQITQNLPVYSPSTISNGITLLWKRDLVKKGISKVNQREHFVFLSDQGNKFYADLEAILMSSDNK